MALHLGIDFGTSTTRVALGTGGGKAPIPLEIGLPGFSLTEVARYTMPSIVAYEKGDDGIPRVFAVGEKAADLDPRDDNYFIVSEVKRLLVAHDRDSLDFRKLEKKYPTWDIKAGKIRVWDYAIAAQDVAKAIVTEAVDRALKALEALPQARTEDGNISFSTGIPALAGSRDRATLLEVMQDSGVSGIKSDAISEEPVLALIPHYFYDQFTVGERLLVCDIGGGTTDVAILTFKESPSGGLAAEVGLVHGRPFLGGSDIDEAVITYILSRMAENGGLELEELRKLFDESFDERKGASYNLKRESIRIKEGLSTAAELTVSDYISSMFGDTLAISIRQQDLKDLIKKSNFVSEVLSCITEAIYIMDVFDNGGFTIPTSNNGGFKYLERKQPDEIRGYADKIFLVGGTCQMPAIRDELEKYLTIDSNRQIGNCSDVDPQLATSLGAAERGQLDFSGLLRQLPFDVTLESPCGVVVEKLYAAFDIAYGVQALLQREIIPYRQSFTRKGPEPHIVAFKEHGEPVYKEQIKFPSRLGNKDECIFEIDLFGRCLVRFGKDRAGETQMFDFTKYQTEAQRKFLGKFEQNKFEKLEEGKRRAGQLLDIRADRDNNR